MRIKFKKKAATWRYTYKVQIDRKAVEIEDKLRYWQRRKDKKHEKFYLHSCWIIKVGSAISHNEGNSFLTASYKARISVINCQEDGEEFISNERNWRNG